MKLFILATTSLVLFACNITDTDLPVEVPVLPVFNQQSAARAVIPDGLGSSDAIARISTPLLTRFDANNLGVRDGETFSIPVFDTPVSIKVTQDGSTGVFTYSGAFDDGSGEVTITYDPSTREFTYYQIAQFDDDHNQLGNGPDSRTLAIMDIGPTALNDDGYFQNTVSFFGYTRWLSPSDTYVGIVSASDVAVMYRGQMTTDDANSVGTGFAHYQMKGSMTPSDFGIDIAEENTYANRAYFLGKYAEFSTWADYSNEGFVTYLIDGEGSAHLVAPYVTFTDVDDFKTYLPTEWAQNLQLTVR